MIIITTTSLGNNKNVKEFYCALGGNTSQEWALQLWALSFGFKFALPYIYLSLFVSELRSKIKQKTSLKEKRVKILLDESKCSSCDLYISVLATVYVSKTR